MSSGRQRFIEKMQRRHEELLRLGTDEHYLDTPLYDYEYADRTDDIRWYRTLAAEYLSAGSTLVELGAGTGRITLPLAGDGHRIIAVDRMASMIDALQKRLARKNLTERVSTMQADMRQLELSKASVDMVLAPFNTLMHLYTWQDLVACFSEVHRICRPGGVFAFDVQLPDLEWLMWDSKVRHAVTRFVHPKTKERLVYSTNHRYDPQTQVNHIRIYYDEAPPRGKKFRPPAVPKKLVHLAHRMIFPEELRLLVATTGFEMLTHSADFLDIPLREGCDSQTVVCRKPSGKGVKSRPR